MSGLKNKKTEDSPALDDFIVKAAATTKTKNFAPRRRILAHKNLSNKRIPTGMGDLDAQIVTFRETKLAILIIPENPEDLENPKNAMHSNVIESLIAWCIKNKISAVRYNPLIFSTNREVKSRDSGRRREKNTVKSIDGSVIQANYVLDCFLEHLEDEECKTTQILAFGYMGGAGVAMQLALRRPEIPHAFACSPRLTTYDFSSWMYLNRGKKFTVVYGGKEKNHNIFLDFAQLLHQKEIIAKHYVTDTDEHMGDCQQLLEKLETTIKENNLMS
jgi:hypothetical protein